MIFESMKKGLSGIIIAAFLVVYTAPVGVCITSTPTMSTGVNKPVLRAPTSASTLKLEGDLSISKGNPKISLSLRDSDVQQVLRMFADKAGLNIIFHESAKGSVTLDLVNVPLNEAFKLVMQVTNLTYYIDNNTMVVASADAAQKLNLSKQEMMVIPVKYVDAVIIADFLNKNIFSMNRPGLSNSQIVITEPSTNELLIFGTKNDFLMAQKIVNQFDAKPLEQTFVVNHTTPAEMSSLLCNLLFKENTGSGSSGGGSGGGGASSGFSSPSGSTTSPNSYKTPPSLKPGSYNPGLMPSSSSSSSFSPSPVATPSAIPGRPTGGAADSGSGGSAISGSASSGSSGGSSGGGGSSGSSIALGTGVIACNYNSTATAGSLSSIKEGSLSVTFFPQRGTITVRGGSSQQMEIIRDFIAKNDVKQPQAYLEVSIIELNTTGTRDFTNDWKVWSPFFCGSFDGTTETNSLYPNFLLGSSYGIVDDTGKITKVVSKYDGSNVLTYSMSYLIKNTKGRVLANPRVLVTNGQTSMIDLSSDYVKKVTSQVLQGTSSLNGTTQKTYEIGTDGGITVEINPFISPDGYVVLNIKPKYSTIKEKIPDSNGDLAATLMQRRNLDLKNVRIKDGETLVLGGMITEDEEKTVSKLPVLGDLPGVGMFFRNTHTEKQKQELVIMITPKIVKDTEDVVNNTGTNL